MRMIKYGVLVLFSLLPLMFSHSINADISLKTNQIQVVYENIIKTAVSDGCTALKNFNKGNFEYTNLRAIDIDPEEGINAFLNSLYYSFNTLGENEKEVLKGYIPVIVIIGYDGYYLYTVDEYVDQNGLSHLEHILLPKKYYEVVDDNGNIINFTLDEHVKVYDIDKDEIHEGDYRELKGLSPLLNGSDFEIEKKDLIISQIEDSMNYYVNNHNLFSEQLGIIYDFTLPRIDKADWYNAVEDIGMIAIFQGKPICRNKYLNIFSYNGASILKSKAYIGFTSQQGIKYYVEKDKAPANCIVEKVFQSQKEAAMEGYYPLE